MIYFDLVNFVFSCTSLDFGSALRVVLLMISLQAPQDDAIKQKESLANEVKLIGVELQQVREDRESQVTQVQALIAEVREKYKEVSRESVAELDNLTTKSNALEVCNY